MVTILIWAVNFSVVKATIGHLHPLAFNSLRLVGASIVLLVLARLAPGPGIQPEDRLRIVVLGLVGHTGYQLLFIHGINRTAASTSALLLSMTPVFVAALSHLFAIERPSTRLWAGIAVSVLGVCLVLWDSARAPTGTTGDWMTLGATLCWAFYTVLGTPIVARYGLFKTNALTMAVGSVCFLPFGLPELLRLSPSSVPAGAWWGTLFSFLFALVVGYCLWYFAVSKIGPTETAIYSNLMPVAALIVARVSLGEAIGTPKILGAAIILTGIYLVRRAPRGSA